MASTNNNIIPTGAAVRPEDLIGGGGTFSSCLTRAIRRPIIIHSSSSSNNNAVDNNANNNSNETTKTQPITIGTALADAISRSTSSDAANQDANNNNSGYNHTTTTATKPTTPTRPSGAKNDNDLTDNNINNNGGDGGSSEQQQDWSTHHISYPLLKSTLHYFTQRRALIRTKLLNDTNNNNAQGSIISSNNTSSSGLLWGSRKKNNKKELLLTEEEFNLTLNECQNDAPFLKSSHLEGEEGTATIVTEGENYKTASVEEGGGGSGREDLMEYASERALGRTPPGGGGRRLKKMMFNKDKDGADNNSNKKGDLTMANVLISGCAGVPLDNTEEEGGKGVLNESCSPYVRMTSNTSTSTSMLNESEIIKRLSFMERSELSAVLDSEVERAVQFYRKRVGELAPPRVDGGSAICFDGGGGCGGLEMEIPSYNCGGDNAAGGVVGCGGGFKRSGGGGESTTTDHTSLLSQDDDDELIAPSQDREQLTFTEMASEILELHAYITTNIIVVRQVLIKYDAYVRSLGGTPMGSWYQTTRRQKVNGRSSDYRDLINHSKLKKLTKAYIMEYKRHLEEEEEEEIVVEEENDEPFSSSGGMKKRKKKTTKKVKRRLKGLSMAFYKIVDAGEEMKKRQRLKWRQSAMHLEDDDDEEEDAEMEGYTGVSSGGGDEGDQMELGEGLDPPSGGGGGGSNRAPVIVGPLDGPTAHTTPPRHSSSKASVESSMSKTTTTATSKRLLETPPPNPPLQPVPDYSTLRTNPDLGEDIAYQVHIFKCVQSKTQRSIEKTYNGHISGVYDNFISTIREYFLLGSATDNLSLMPEYLVMRGKSLKSSLLVVAQWREARNAYLYGLAHDGDVEAGGGGMDGRRRRQGMTKSWFGGFCGENQPPSSSPMSSSQPCSSFKSSFALFLNIFACFLYMMNYYIVEPSSTRYANALGTSDAMSGLIIGAMPWAAMLSAIVYSIWSNTCYKAPLITSGALLVAGNVLYATAYRYESITMALSGRFLTGLGGPRSMNRRYIADTTPVAQRTAVNAAFGTATAMGAALGPATAIMLDGVDVEFNLPLYGRVYFNGMTGPGFVMGCLWILFTLILALTFEEPHRSGLEEQMHNEKLQTSSTATAGRSPPRSEYEMSNLDASRSIRSRNASSSLDRQNLSESNLGYNSNASQPEPFEETRSRGVLDSFGCPTMDGKDICDHEISCIGSKVDDDNELDNDNQGGGGSGSIWQQAKFISNQITGPVRICMFLLFSKMFTVESVISAASMLTKNRYGWAVQQVGTLGTIIGCLTIPISIFIGWVSQYREDRVLMLWLISIATFGMGLLIDVTDFVSTETETYNEGHTLAVGPYRYISGYLLVFCSVQAFDGVVGSVLSKVIPTALATGTLVSL